LLYQVLACEIPKVFIHLSNCELQYPFTSLIQLQILNLVLCTVVICQISRVKRIMSYPSPDTEISSLKNSASTTSFYDCDLRQSISEKTNCISNGDSRSAFCYITTSYDLNGLAIFSYCAGSKATTSSQSNFRCKPYARYNA
jgi:hypothetical protein